MIKEKANGWIHGKRWSLDVPAPRLFDHLSDHYYRTDYFLGPLASPDYLRNKPPAYPLTARRKGYEGVVVLRVEVLSDGNPDRIEVRKSSGYAILDEAAYEAVKEWKFKPAMRGDKPIDSWVEIPIRFTLRDG